MKKFFFPITLIGLCWIIILSPTFKEVAAGVAILLFGMIMLEEGFRSFVEGPLKNLIKKVTNTLIKSLGLGFTVTALLQSSSLISVITISFISAGLLELYAGIGIIFGSNLGTAATAWLISIFGLKVNIASLAMPMLIFGILFVFQGSKKLKGIGNALAGLGFFFLGIYFMKNGFEGYQNGINLSDYTLSGFWGLITFVFIGILITLILQSSSAAMALVITALAAGQISYENSLALAIGANIGTTITAIIGSLSSNIPGRQLAAAHFIFNIITGLIAMIFFIPLESLVNIIGDYSGLDPENYPIKLSIFHTIFNLIGVLVMAPLIKPLIRFLKRIIAEKPKEDNMEYPKYLNESILEFPQTAIRALLDESKRLFEKATFEIIAHGLNLHRKDIQGKEKIKKLVRESKKELKLDVEEIYYRKVKIIYSKIIKYASLAQGKFSLTPEAMEAFTRIKLANRNIVETMAAIQGLRSNVTKYMRSDNKNIQKEYDRLRQKVSRVLRVIHHIKTLENPAESLEKLEALKSRVKQSDPLIDGSLDKLIRDQKISSVMASSLAQDSKFVAKIIIKLIDTAELLYIERDTLIKTTEEKEKTNS